MSSTVNTASVDDPNGALRDPARLRVLRNTGLLGVRNHPSLDVIARLAAKMTGSPTAVVSLVDADRQVNPAFFSQDAGVEDPGEVPLSHSFCRYVVAGDAPLIVSDARTHPVLHDHAAVQEYGVIAYAGYPLHAPDGEVLGALCVVDVVPRSWTEDDLGALRDLVTAVDTKIALRLARRDSHLSHERMLHVFSESTSTLIVLADVDGVVRTMNQTAQDTLGEAAADYVGTWTLEGLAAVSRLNGAAQEHDGAQDWILPQPDGRQRIFSVRISSLHDLEGAVDGYIVVGDDVTARRHAEDALRESLRTQADALERLQELDLQKTAFITTASHELRTPVTSILGYTALLAEGQGGELSSAQRGMVSRIDRNGRRLLELVEDLTTLGQSDAAPSQAACDVVEAQAVVSGAWERFTARLPGRELKASLQAAPGLGRVVGDQAELERALTHVLVNAVKFTPDGGAITLSVSCDDGEVRFEVTDTGVGIPQHQQDAVFEPFFRTPDAEENATQGSGVGLTITRRIVEAHGGRLTLSSAVGRGTTVRFTLPVAGPLS